jgi:hypothetical protein
MSNIKIDPVDNTNNKWIINLPVIYQTYFDNVTY